MSTPANPLFEAKPRWPGAPPICIATNRLAHKSKEAWQEFYDTNCPRLKIIKLWVCEVCGCWHSIGVAPDPSGDSSGTGRSSK